MLEWALDLEQRDVVGEGLTFSDGERERAQSTPVTTITIGTIGNMAGTIGGSVRDQHICATQTASEGDFLTQVSNFTDATRKLLEDSPDDEGVEDVQAALAEVDAEAEKPNPDKGAIKKALRKVVAAAVGLGTCAAQTAITTEIGRLLGAK